MEGAADHADGVQVGRLDVRAHANAGHNPPILIRANGDSGMLDGGGPVLGILPNAPYSEARAYLDSGDLLVLYSDGVTEATNTGFDEYGEERLISLLRGHRHLSASAIVDAVTKSLAEFTAGAPQADDITLVVARRVSV